MWRFCQQLNTHNPFLRRLVRIECLYDAADARSREKARKYLMAAWKAGYIHALSLVQRLRT
jgi:hypothetical protein